VEERTEFHCTDFDRDFNKNAALTPEIPVV